MVSASEIAAIIDHTVLSPDAKKGDIETACQEAIRHSFKTVCVRMEWLPLVVRALKDSSILPITVIGFPGGLEATVEKVTQTQRAIQDGAREIDMVLNRQLLVKHDYQAVYSDIKAVVDQSAEIPVKVIIETSELTQQQKVISCCLAKAAGAAFVKTSTGFTASGATKEDVELMRQVVGPNFGVKASGGIRTQKDAEVMIAAGASRLGCSASVAIVTGSVGGDGAY